MPKRTMEELETLLKRFFDLEPTPDSLSDINEALRVADLLETRGYSFQLKDMCPKSLDDSLWRAAFSRDGKEFPAEDSQPAAAVCVAALAALREAEASGI